MSKRMIWLSRLRRFTLYRGDTNKAFEWLERAYKRRDGGLPNMKGDPLLRNIVSDQRYRVFLQNMKLPLD